MFLLLNGDNIGVGLTAPLGAVRSGSPLFAHAYLSENLRSLRQHTADYSGIIMIIPQTCSHQTKLLLKHLVITPTHISPLSAHCTCMLTGAGAQGTCPEVEMSSPSTLPNTSSPTQANKALPATIMFLSFWTDRSGQTVQTQIREAVWSGSTLFAIPSASFGLITLW